MLISKILNQQRFWVYPQVIGAYWEFATCHHSRMVYVYALVIIQLLAILILAKKMSVSRRGKLKAFYKSVYRVV